MENIGQTSEEAVNSYHMRSPGIIRVVYSCLLVTEILTLFIVIMLSAYFLYLLRRTVFFHYNLKILFASYNIFAISVCISRNTWLISELAYLSVYTMEIVMIVKNILHNAMSAHLWTISAERFVATRKCRDYEESSNPTFMAAIVAFTVFNGFIQTYLKYEFSHGRELTAVIAAIFTLTAFLIMVYTYYKNKKLMSNFQWTSNRSHSYQIRENIKVSRTMNKCFIVGAAGMMFGSFCLMFFSSSKRTTNDWATIFWGFGFDMASALTTLVVPFIVILSEESDLSRRSYAIFGFLKFCPLKSTHKQSIKDYQGRRITLTVDVTKDSQLYFEQLQKEWA